MSYTYTEPVLYRGAREITFNTVSGPGAVRYDNNPIGASSPAGPASLPYPRPAGAGLGFAPGGGGSSWWQDLISGFTDPYYGGGGGDPYTVPPVTTYAPYCQSIWPWVLGTAVLMLVLNPKKG